VSANNFIRAGYRLFEPHVPWAWPHTVLAKAASLSEWSQVSRGAERDSRNGKSFARDEAQNGTSNGPAA